MRKFIIYTRYLFEYLKYGDIVSIIASVKYVANQSSHSSDRIVHSTMGTFFCRRNTNDFQFANYAYEWSVKKYVLDHRHEYTIFIDGGAGIGEYSILLANNKLRCIAFEPVKSTYSVLMKNLKLNNLNSEITAFPYGLGAENKQAEFMFNTVNTGASHIVLNGLGDCKAEIRTIDSLLPELNFSPDDRILFKLDVEGMEPDALRGASEFIKNHQHLTFVMEDKHSGEETIQKTLSSIAPFEFGYVDEYNIYAKKINQ